jgi:superfamily II DNA or RNA helicase
MTELRPYQRDVLTELDGKIEAGNRRIIIVAPTGAGKTIIGAAIIKNAIENNRRVLVLAHTREIITQTSTKFFGRGIQHGIIQADFPTRPDEAVQVASVQTLWVRAMCTRRMKLPLADLLVVDECHHCPANTYRKIIDAYPQALLIGLTATPCRGDGRGLGGIFETIVECPQVAELIDLKYLVRTRHHAPVNPDLRGVETRVGDYVESQLAEQMDRAGLVGDIVTHWHKYGERRKTVCFAVNVAHSLHIRDEFQKSGVRAEHIDGATPKAERDAILARLAGGETELVTNCMVLTEGLGHARSRLLHSGPTNAEDRIVSANGRSGLAASVGKNERNYPRSQRRRVSSWLCRRSRRMDSRPGQARGKPHACPTARAGILFALARMQQVRRHAGRGRALPALWISSATPAQANRLH